MTGLRLCLCSLVLGLAVGGVAHASPGQSREIIKESIKIEETRAKELEGMAEHDEKLAKEIDKLVKVREKYAAAAEATAKRTRDELGGVWPHNTEADAERRALEKFAAAMEEFAKHDHEQAHKRKQAEDILLEQAKSGEEAARKHREYVTELKAKLAAMK